MGTVTIGTDTFDVYGTSTALASYAAGSLVHGDTYAAATATQRDRALVEATRTLLALPWSDTDNADVTTAVAAVVQAAYELALYGLADASVFTAPTASDKVKAMGAGKASIEFFGPTAVGRFPRRVMDLIGALLDDGGGAVDGIGDSEAAGTDAESDFDTADTYGLTSG